MATKKPKTSSSQAHSAETALTPAQKQRNYRLRQRQRSTEAITDPETASRVTLIGTLSKCLEQLDNYTGRSQVLRENMRWGAQNAIKELATRYRLEI